MLSLAIFFAANDHLIFADKNPQALPLLNEEDQLEEKATEKGKGISEQIAKRGGDGSKKGVKYPSDHQDQEILKHRAIPN